MACTLYLEANEHEEERYGRHLQPEMRGGNVGVKRVHAPLAQYEGYNRERTARPPVQMRMNGDEGREITAIQRQHVTIVAMATYPSFFFRR